MKSGARHNHQIIFNHDGFGLLAELAETGMTETDAAKILVEPLAGTAVTTIDWCILTTGEHNCRLPHGRPYDGRGIGQPLDAAVGRVVAHYNAAPLDLLGIVIKHGHLNGLKIYGNIRLNHSLNNARLAACPGRSFMSREEPLIGARKDFRDDDFQAYLMQLIADLIERGVDGITLDFERKAPFFPPAAQAEEKIAACTKFVRKARALTAKPLLVRVSCDPDKGIPQGQDPEAWLRSGLIDIVVPATHNHEPDNLRWKFERFLAAGKHSPGPVRVCPQIWPTGEPWNNGRHKPHSVSAVIDRAGSLLQSGAGGVYFFNFCCYGSAYLRSQFRAVLNALQGAR